METPYVPLYPVGVTHVLEHLVLQGLTGRVEGEITVRNSTLRDVLKQGLI